MQVAVKLNLPSRLRKSCGCEEAEMRVISQQTSKVQVFAVQVWMHRKINRKPGVHIRYEKYCSSCATLARSVVSSLIESMMCAGQAAVCDSRP